MPQYPFQISGIVGRDPEFRAVAEGAGEMRQYLGRDDPSLVMTHFRPRVGKQDKRPAQGVFRQPFHQQPRIVTIKPDIVQFIVTDPRQQLYDPIHEGFAADHAGFGVSVGLPRQVFAAAEADFQPYIVDQGVETGAGVENVRCDGVNLEPWQKLLNQVPLTGTQSSAPPTPVKNASAVRFFFFAGQGLAKIGDHWCRLVLPPVISYGQETAAFRSSTRSVFSHENPPSASGSRPK